MESFVVEDQLSVEVELRHDESSMKKNVDHRGDPLVEETPRISFPHRQDESNTNRTDPKSRDKRNHSEKYKKSRKKRKVDRSSGIIGITNDDYNLIFDKIKEVANERCMEMFVRHAKFLSNITNLPRTLCT